MSQAPDRNSGLPFSTSAYVQQSHDDSKVTATGPSSSTSQTAGQDVARTSSQQISSAVNTTPEALKALNLLITQLTDRPAVSDAELDAKFPRATRIFDKYNGWIWQDPKTGANMSEREAQQYNAKQTAARTVALQEAGTIKGGTEETKNQQAERATEITRDRALQGQYSKDAAIGDAQFLINKAIADSLEAAMPQITAGLEGAGTSRSTMAAYLTQKAGVKGATEGAALGAQLGVQYGQINTQLAGVLEALTRSDPNGPAAMLLQALNASKGMYTAGVTNTNAATVTDKTGTINTQDSGKTAVENGSTRVLPPYMPPAPVLGATTPASAKVAQPTNPYYAFVNTPAGGAKPALETAYQSMYDPQADDLYNIAPEV